MNLNNAFDCVGKHCKLHEPNFKFARFWNYKPTFILAKIFLVKNCPNRKLFSFKSDVFFASTGVNLLVDIYHSYFSLLQLFYYVDLYFIYGFCVPTNINLL